MTYIYCFIREDLTPEQRIVQLGHACHEAGKLIPKEESKDIPSLILLSAQDEDDLILIARKLDCAGIAHSMFYEPDCNRLTGETMGYSAICTRPIMAPRERALFKEYNLFRHTY